MRPKQFGWKLPGWVKGTCHCSAAPCAAFSESMHSLYHLLPHSRHHGLPPAPALGSSRPPPGPCPSLPSPSLPLELPKVSTGVCDSTYTLLPSLETHPSWH